jgi:hypothetical protein
MNDEPSTCQYNPRLDRYEHHMVKKGDQWVCTRCGETADANGKPLALAGPVQIRGERRT